MDIEEVKKILDKIKLGSAWDLDITPYAQELCQLFEDDYRESEPEITETTCRQCGKDVPPDLAFPDCFYISKEYEYYLCEDCWHEKYRGVPKLFTPDRKPSTRLLSEEDKDKMADDNPQLDLSFDDDYREEVRILLDAHLAKDLEF